jgi:hypothetical protein
MENNWQIGTILQEETLDFCSLERFLLDLQMEIQSLEVSLIAMEQTDLRKAFGVEIELLDAAVVDLEKYKQIVEALLKLNIGIQEENKISKILSKGRSIVYWLASGAIFIGSLTTAIVDTSQETKKNVLWFDSILIMIIGVSEIWRRCTSFLRSTSKSKNIREELKRVSYQMTLIRALNNAFKTINGYEKRRERFQKKKIEKNKQIQSSFITDTER